MYTLRSSCSLLLAFALIAAVSTRALAAHHVFSHSVDRFEVDGNAFGPFDGTLDYVDEFDDGTIAPDWTQLLGTSVESGTVVTLKNPGTDYTIGGVSVDVSNIENEEAVVDGGGDFVATSYWLPMLPTTDQVFHFQLYELGVVIESVGLSVGSASVAIPPAIAGPSITQQLTQIGGSFGNQSYDTVAINPADITGEIVLRLSVDDATNLLTSSFSLDGGATFQSPFPSIPIFQSTTGYEFLLGAGVVEGGAPPTPTRTATPTRTSTPTATSTPLPTPQPVGLKMLLVKNPSGEASRKILYKVKDLGHTLSGTPFAGGATFNVKLDGLVQCFHMPQAGWSSLGGRGFKYSDTGGVFGPVKKAQIKKSGNNFRMKVLISGQQGLIYLVPPNPGVQADTNFSFGGGAEYCSSSVGAALGPNDAKTFKAKDALAPAGCIIPACP